MIGGYGIRHSAHHEPTPMPRTWIWIDRHVHKNGGTTVRKIMQKLRGLNVSTYYGWTGAKGLEVLLRRNVTPAWPSGTACEVHEGVGDFMGRHMQRIDATLRPRVERLVLTTRSGRGTQLLGDRAPIYGKGRGRWERRIGS